MATETLHRTPEARFAVPEPLRWDEGGVIRVGAGRITLDLIVERYESGMAPEDMTRAYEALALGDAYAAIAFYLQRQDEVRTYLKKRAAEAAALKDQVEAERPRVPRAELTARRAAAEKADAAAG